MIRTKYMLSELSSTKTIISVVLFMTRLRDKRSQRAFETALIFLCNQMKQMRMNKKVCYQVDFWQCFRWWWGHSAVALVSAVRFMIELAQCLFWFEVKLLADGHFLLKHLVLSCLWLMFSSTLFTENFWGRDRKK